MQHRVSFDRCFEGQKLNALIRTLPRVYSVLDSMAPPGTKYPSRVQCMSDRKIREGRRRGAGHGFTYTRGRGSDTIWMNHYMSGPGYWLVFVHENLHHVFPDATEQELNCSHLPYVYKQVFRQTLDPEWARKHGVGAPRPGIGDRSYCR